MNIVIMAGGKASRLNGLKKPLLHVCSRRLIDVVVSVAKSLIRSGKVYVCISDYVYELIYEDFGEYVEVVICPGKGYVDDLNYILSNVKPPVLVLPSDIPFLSAEIIRKFLKLAGGVGTDVVTLMVCSNDGVCKETGISLFNKLRGSWANIYFQESLELKDVDTEEDLKLVEGLCGSMEGVVRGF